jgi:hypothetical protein
LITSKQTEPDLWSEKRGSEKERGRERERERDRGRKEELRLRDNETWGKVIGLRERDQQSNRDVESRSKHHRANKVKKQIPEFDVERERERENPPFIDVWMVDFVKEANGWALVRIAGGQLNANAPHTAFIRALRERDHTKGKANARQRARASRSTPGSERNMETETRRERVQESSGEFKRERRREREREQERERESKRESKPQCNREFNRQKSKRERRVKEKRKTKKKKKKPTISRAFELYNKFTHTVLFEFHFMIGHHARGDRSQRHGKHKDERCEHAKRMTTTQPQQHKKQGKLRNKEKT